jgi:uncharacterized membrane protein
LTPLTWLLLILFRGSPNSLDKALQVMHVWLRNGTIDALEYERMKTDLEANLDHETTKRR